eukprot:2208575-Lingulodinium_polyedra.AAC.1
MQSERVPDGPDVDRLEDARVTKQMHNHETMTITDSWRATTRAEKRQGFGRAEVVDRHYDIH